MLRFFIIKLELATADELTAPPYEAHLPLATALPDFVGTGAPVAQPMLDAIVKLAGTGTALGAACGRRAPAASHRRLSCGWTDQRRRRRHNTDHRALARERVLSQVGILEPAVYRAMELYPTSEKLVMLCMHFIGLLVAHRT